MKDILVSIVVPVFNGARYLREALDSLVAQTYPSVEILVMDDASTDETPEIARSYGERISYHRSAANQGIYDNVNAGIALARGDLIATYHADDVYERDMVARQVECFTANPGIGAVFCLDILVDAGGREYGRLTLPPEVGGSLPLDHATVVNALLTHQNIFLVCPTAMVAAHVHRAVGVYRQSVWRNSADLEMWLRIVRQYPIVILEQHLMRYRHFAGQSSRRYHHLRAEPGRFFAIMDDHLRTLPAGVVHRRSLRAYEAHRGQDLLMVAVNHYIAGRRDRALTVLRTVRAGQLLASNRIQRWRMAALYLILHVVCRLPQSSLLAALFYWRWQSGRAHGGGTWSGLGAALRAWWRDEGPVQQPAP